MRRSFERAKAAARNIRVPAVISNGNFSNAFSGIMKGRVAIAPQGGKNILILQTAKSMTAHETAADTARGRPAFSVSIKRESTPLNEAVIISETACGERSRSLLPVFDISKKATISGGAMKNISFVRAGIMQIRLAAASCLMRRLMSCLSGCTGVKIFFSRIPVFSNMSCARSMSEVMVTTEAM